MGWVFKFAKSSIGAKVIMAVTGLVLFGFVLVHMAGNLQVFLGQEAYNKYAHFLKSLPELLWPARAVLLSSVLLHIASGLRLAALDRAARPIGYQDRRYRKASIMSRTMAWSGLVVLSFIVYHLLHFTFGLTDPSHHTLKDPAGQHDVYSMLIYGFQNVYVAVAYMVSMVLLGIHLSHGASSLFQTLGINHPRYNGAIAKIGPIFATLIVIGNVSMPLAVLLGWIKLPAGAL
jgi:succinate dehydrogenase / fumarate reductase cytochrome b subunit